MTSLFTPVYVLVSASTVPTSMTPSSVDNTHPLLYVICVMSMKHLLTSSSVHAISLLVPDSSTLFITSHRSTSYLVSYQLVLILVVVIAVKSYYVLLVIFLLTLLTLAPIPYDLNTTYDHLFSLLYIRIQPFLSLIHLI